jgi:hypothetical protein
MGPINSPETSVRNQPTLHNIPEDNRTEAKLDNIIGAERMQEYRNALITFNTYFFNAKTLMRKRLNITSCTQPVLFIT